MAIIKRIIHLFIFMFMLSLPIVSLAEIVSWQIIPEESSLSFTGVLNDASTSGQFNTFTGNIFFDPEHLDQSSVAILIDISSIHTSYAEVADTLKMPDWFDAKLFPQAKFEANRFKKIKDKTYEAEGKLSIREKSLPVKVTFTEEDYANNKVRIKGSTNLKRLDFGIGRGEWASTKEVKDDVQVNFIITAKKK